MRPERARTPGVTDAWWSRYAHAYDPIWDTPLTRAVAAALADAMPPGELMTLDVGCGTGLIGAVLEEHGHKVIGADRSAAMVELARRRGLSVLLADANALPLRAGCVSVVSAVNLLHVMAEPDFALGEILRVTAAGGRVGLVWPTDVVTIEKLYRAERRLGRRRFDSASAGIRRFAIGVSGTARRIRRHTNARLSDFVGRCAADQGLVTELDQVLFGVQRLIVLRKQ